MVGKSEGAETRLAPAGEARKGRIWPTTAEMAVVGGAAGEVEAGEAEAGEVEVEVSFEAARRRSIGARR